MKEPMINEPRVGQVIYVPTSLYVFRGRDDFQGGKATISTVTENENLPPDHFNRIFVSIEERPNHGYNWNSLVEKQEEYKEIFGERWAHPDPDLDPSVNDDNEGWKQV